MQLFFSSYQEDVDTLVTRMGFLEQVWYFCKHVIYNEHTLIHAPM